MRSRPDKPAQPAPKSSPQAAGETDRTRAASEGWGDFPTVAGFPGFEQRKRAASRLALISNGILLILKVLAAAVTGSVAILAEVVNSGADLAGSAIVYWSVRASEEPPDDTHSYGHGKLEDMSGVLTATLILAGGGYAVWQSVLCLVHPAHLVHLNLALGVMAVSAGINVVVSARLLHVGRATESPALVADGFHLRTDILSSLGVLAGLALVRLTGRDYWDPVAGLCVSLAILRIGYVVAHGAIDTLADHSLPDAERHILEDVLRANPAVRGFHRLRTRRAGPDRHADVHVLLDDGYTLVEAHRLAEQIEDQMRDALPNLDPMVHPEPHQEELRHQRERHALERARHGISDENIERPT
ncbi:MAG: cation diffusion facilitator family transporter [Capsulimonadaceae bacterium]